MLGSWVETGDILVGKLTPHVAKKLSYTPGDKLLRAILGECLFLFLSVANFNTQAFSCP